LEGVYAGMQIERVRDIYGGILMVTARVVYTGVFIDSEGRL
jgi:hypothetical protein